MYVYRNIVKQEGQVELQTTQEKRGVKIKIEKQKETK